MTTLDELAIGQNAKILGLAKHAASYRRKLLALGLTPQTTLTIVRVAPMGDPVEIRSRGCNLSLRRTEACLIEVEII
jgi:ferrous iron transport protein A